MSAGRERLLAISGVAVGALWLLAAGAKLVALHAAYEMAARVAPAGLPPKPFLAVAIAAETFLGAAMCLRAVRGFAWSLAGVLAATAALVTLRAESGPDAACGCFGVLFGTTVDGALVRNAALVAAHAALLWIARAKGARQA